MYRAFTAVRGDTSAGVSFGRLAGPWSAYVSVISRGPIPIFCALLVNSAVMSSANVTLHDWLNRQPNNGPETDDNASTAVAAGHPPLGHGRDAGQGLLDRHRDHLRALVWRSCPGCLCPRSDRYAVPATGD